MDQTELTTYQALVYQSRANRSIKAHFERVLHDYNLTMMQWSVLGFIKDAGKRGIRISDLAEKLDTSLAFITNSVNALEQKGIVFRTGHSSDNRAKMVCVTDAYRKRVNSIEGKLSKELLAWTEKLLQPQDREVFTRVVKLIAESE